MICPVENVGKDKFVKGDLNGIICRNLHKNFTG